METAIVQAHIRARWSRFIALLPPSPCSHVRTNRRTANEVTSRCGGFQLMLIVDAQVHIWQSGTPIAHHRQVPAYTKDELLRDMDAAGVSAVVLHPPSWDTRANEVAIDAARQHSDRLAILGFFDISKPGNRSLITDWKQQPGML